MSAPVTHRREVPEWIGKTPNSAIPPRVQLRVIERAGNCCASCHHPFTALTKPEIDHIVALVNGGENREGNLQALCRWCHRPKTDADVALKAKVARVRAKYLGIEGDTRNKRPVGGWAAKKFKKMPDGRVVDRITGEEIGKRR